ncbi:MAG: SdrD B-like domain-containing protein [Saprospiraceae bacterium]
MNPNQHFGYSFLRAKNLAQTLFLLLLPCLVSAQLSVTINGVSPTCNGWTNGSVGATVSNGTPPLLFSWNGGAPTNSNVLASIGAGTYTVDVTDGNNQTGSATFILTEPDAVVVSVTTSGGCTGGSTATATASGGTGGYTYLWDDGSTGATASGLSVGLHCVTVTDASGCQAVGCGTITSVLMIDMVVQGLACFNFCDASVEAIVTGGTPPYTYLWSNGFMGGVNANLGPGTYDVTVTDAAGCTITGSATVGNPAQINIDVTVTNPPCGSGATGSATASATGGTAPYTFIWSNGVFGSMVSNLSPGTYGLTVTDFLGCQESTSVLIIEDAGVDLGVASTPSSGCGAPDGTASVFINGGTPPFSILWSNGSTASDVTGLAPGTYTVMVTDGNGCGANTSVTVDGSPAIDLNITGVNSGCAANGSASAMVTPGTGTPPFQFSWSNGANTAIINNITAGTYSVTVVDAAGCTATDEITVSGSSNIAVTTTVTNNSCFGGNNGSAIANVTGATGPIVYMWSNGGNAQMIFGLATGTYFVTVVDNASGCTATTNAFISQPTEVVATATGVNAGCSSLGSAEAAANGGTSPYTFVWNNGETSQSITGLSAGTYTVTATDANGCTDVASVSIVGGGSLNVDVQITNPISGSNVDDGAVEASASGGVQPYTYLWSTGDTGPTLSGLGGGTYTVTVTDVEGCTGTATVTLFQPGCIGDRVWNDANRNGCQDPGELGVGGIAVTLSGTDVNGNAVSMSQVTMPNGFYQFEDLLPGSYTVSFNLPSGFAFSPANNCSDDFSDSDANSSGSTGTINLTEGQCNVTVDAGIYDDCLNISDPGEICCDQYLCGPGNDPAPITSITPASGGGSAVQYMWMYSTINVPFNPNFWSPVPGATGASYDPGPLQETTYFTRCAKAAACDTWLESNVVTITVGMEAFAEITGPDLVCVGDPATYTATANTPGASYSWNFGSWATPSTSTSQTPTVTWSQFGIVHITLTVQYGDCISTTEMGVAVSDSPIICGSPLVVTGNNVGNAVVLSWAMEQAPGNYSFVVERSANGVDYNSLATMPQSTTKGLNEYAFTDYFPKAGNARYRVQLVKENETLSYSNEVMMQNFKESQMFATYPNPVADKLVIECSNGIKTAVQAELLSTQGQVVTRIKIPTDAMNYSLDMSTMRSGAYFLRLTYNDGVTELVRVVKR